MNLNHLSLPLVLNFGDYCLRPLQPSDAPDWYAYLSVAEVTRLTSYNIQSVDDVSRMIEHYVAGYAQKSSMRWALTRKDSDLLLGTCGYYWWDSANSMAELGYDLSQAHWGKGIMTAAVRTVIQWGFEVLEINRIQATVMVDNVGSAHVLEKNGFQCEGTLRELKIACGEPRDFWMYALLRREYHP